MYVCIEIDTDIVYAHNIRLIVYIDVMYIVWYCMYTYIYIYIRIVYIYISRYRYDVLHLQI